VGRIVDYYGASGYRLFMYPTNRLSWGTGNQIYTSNNSITLGAWNHVVVSCASNRMTTIYVDGEVVMAATQSSVADPDGTAVCVIGNNATGDRAFDGDIDDFRVFDKALSQTEAQGLYALGHGTASEAVPYKLDVDGNGYINGDLLVNGEVLYPSDPTLKRGLAPARMERDVLVELANALSSYTLKSHTEETVRTRTQTWEEIVLENVDMKDEDARTTMVLVTRDEVTTRPSTRRAPVKFGFDATKLPAEAVRDVNGKKLVSLDTIGALLTDAVARQADEIEALRQELGDLRQRVENLERTEELRQ